MRQPTCPLEIDWLEYLEGTVSTTRRAELEGHLGACPSCRALVEAIREQALGLGPPPEISPQADPRGRAGTWPEDREAVPREGDLWLTAAGHGDGAALHTNSERMPVVLMPSPRREGAETIFDAIAFSSIGEDPDEAQLPVSPDENSLGLDLRVLSARRMALRASQLEARVGKVTAAALARLRGATEEPGGPQREPAPVIPIARYREPSRSEAALAAASQTVTIGVDDTTRIVVLEDEGPEEGEGRRAEVQVRLRPFQAWIRPRQGEPLKLAWESTPLPVDEFTPVPIEAEGEGRSLAHGADLLSELRRILKWA